ncbi:hypothetical protein ACFOET_13290 [Parapedobacter deserti]|uniref:PDZ domain-containing protein n=1 Tax=Parapedobacter deserti TaxID=1912957 RepID=A0ABV7JQK1_9SPHI
MKKKLIPFLYVALFGILSLVSCKKKVSDAGEKRIKEQSTIDIGLKIPELRDTRNDTVGVALYPSAMPYFIDAGLVQSEDNIRLIKQAMKSSLPVRVKVYEDNQHEIAIISPATDDDIARHRESQKSRIFN